MVNSILSDFYILLIFEVYIISAYIDLMVYVGTLLWFKFAKITSPIVGDDIVRFEMVRMTMKNINKD